METTNTRPITIWDNFTRIYHISQLLLLATLWYSAEEANFELHFQCAFTLLGLWCSRIIWGLFGSDTSRFSHFIRSPLSIFKAWKDKTLSKPYPGHNPVAGYMVMALLITLGVQLFTGLFATDDVLAEGPLYYSFSESFAEKMDSLHHSNFDILLVLVIIHAIAGFAHVFKGDNVLKAIFTGKKALPAQTHQPKLRSSWIALLIWFGVSASVYNWGMAAASY